MNFSVIHWAPLIMLAGLPTFVVGSAGTICAAEPHHFATVPALAVSSKAGKESGGLHYIVIQPDQDHLGRGPTILFNEQARGSAVGDEWKEAVRIAVTAAAKAVGADARKWTVTIRNRTYSSYTEGASAGSAVAIGIMAAWRGDTLRPDAVMTGEIDADGRIGPVDRLPGKLEGAALAKMHTMLIPRGQARTDEWDLFELGRQRQVTVIEVGELLEAYELMTGNKP